ncbi:hypothetical protein [Engelhardtia mirabilis]|uniref:Glycosyltransferase RgtA/B/C/D-like domain-containing protein n=1 Tax=Engelhardtia mirabilis TaxID=2528011 RepID=A0A518BNW3_9BACT|nr:hypothetical protein Pla133_37720 [Planctomycetes bacterium Pla133]QDV02997.1 hypothetical protein Pla86_37710 [Planctomycetes bacterium Pla86]
MSSSTAATEDPRSHLAGDLAVGLASLAFFLFSVPVWSDALILGNDVVPYAVGLRASGTHALANPHHLGFHPLAWLALQVLGLFGQGTSSVVDALHAQIWISSAGGAVTAVILHRFARELCGARLALALVVAFCAAAGNWLYAAVGESYLPATACVAGLLVEALRARLGLIALRVPVLALWLLLATVMRQDAVFVAIALPLLLPLPAATRVIALAGCASLATYFAVWSAAGDVGFLPWLRGLADLGEWGGGLPSWFDLQLGAVTLQHALHFGVRYPGATTVASLATTALLVAAAWPARGARRGERAAGLRGALLGLLVYTVVRHAFFTWWQPGNMEYHAGTLLPLSLVLVLAASTHAPPRRRAVGLTSLAALLLVAGNWSSLIEPNRATTMDDRVDRVLAEAGPQALVLSLTGLQHYAVLRAERPGVEAHSIVDAARFAREEDLAAIEAQVEAHLASGHSVVVLRDSVLSARLGLGEQRLEPALIEIFFRHGTVERFTDDRDEVFALVIARGP